MTSFADHPCPTCHTPPHQPCPALVQFGGAHAARITTAKENTMEHCDFCETTVDSVSTGGGVGICADCRGEAEVAR